MSEFLDFGDPSLFDDDNLDGNVENTQKAAKNSIKSEVFPDECSNCINCFNCKILDKLKEKTSRIDDHIASWLEDIFVNESYGIMSVKSQKTDELNEKEVYNLTTTINGYCSKVKLLLNLSPEEINNIFHDVKMDSGNNMEIFESKMAQVLISSMKL